MRDFIAPLECMWFISDGLLYEIYVLCGRKISYFYYLCTANKRARFPQVAVRANSRKPSNKPASYKSY